jgi:hypothetical protein
MKKQSEPSEKADKILGKKIPKLQPYEIAQKIINLNSVDRRHQLANLEIRQGENRRKQVEFELNLLKREQNYAREAQMFYDNYKNIGSYPKDYKNFPDAEKEVYQRINEEKKQEIELNTIKDQHNTSIVEQLLLYRIAQSRIYRNSKGKTRKLPYTPHLIPKGMKDVTAEISMEAERLFNIWQQMQKHHYFHPESERYGTTHEERMILKRVRILKKKEEEKEKEPLKEKVKQILIPETRVTAEDLIKKPWYRKNTLNKDQLQILKDLGYQKTDKNHKVYGFDTKLVGCIAFKEGGFKYGRYNSDKRESLHHFSRPFLLHELSPNTQVLVNVEGIKGEDRTIDAVITYYDNNQERKVAVEFQESHSLSVERITEKIKPILAAFDVLIIVCLDKFKKLYNQDKDTKLHVVNNKEFLKLLKEWKVISFADTKSSSDNKKG